MRPKPAAMGRAYEAPAPPSGYHRPGPGCDGVDRGVAMIFGINIVDVVLWALVVALAVLSVVLFVRRGR